MVVNNQECDTDLLKNNGSKYYPMRKDGFEYGYNYIYLNKDIYEGNYLDKDFINNQEIWKDFGNRSKTNITCKSINIDVAKQEF